MIEKCPKKREKLEGHKKQFKADQEKLDELMPDVLPEADDMFHTLSFAVPISNTQWNKRWEARRRTKEAISRKRWNSV
jgi:hypothetical protein